MISSGAASRGHGSAREAGASAVAKSQPGASVIPPPPKVKLPTDLPTDLADDRLGHRTYVEVIAETLRHNAPPVTVGFFGPWGVGKSSVLKALENELVDDTTDFVLFNAWRYEHNSLRREILRTVASSISTSRETVLRVPIRRRLSREMSRLDVDRQAGKVRLRLTAGSVALLVVLVALVGAAILGLREWLPSVIEPFGGGDIDQGQALAATIALASLLVTLVCLLFRPVTVVETRRRLEDPEQFEEMFRTIIKRATKDRVVIAVDDLDRCGGA